MSRPVLRFAPSPNGYLHLGHALSALVTWKAAELLGGTALLRIEDIDVQRCKPEFTEAIFEDLAWLGLSWPEPVLIQSERFDLYADAANRLRDADLLYPCFCSRSEIAERSTSNDPDGAPLYPGTCRHLSNAERITRLERGDPVQSGVRQVCVQRSVRKSTSTGRAAMTTAPGTAGPVAPRAWQQAPNRARPRRCWLRSRRDSRSFRLPGSAGGSTPSTSRSRGSPGWFPC